MLINIVNVSEKPQPVICAWCGQAGHTQGVCVEYLIHRLEEDEKAAV